MKFGVQRAWLGRAASLCLALLWMGVFTMADASSQKTLHVAAAADLETVLPTLASAYEKFSGVKLVISYGASGILTTQILNGAPMDLFLGADADYPRKIIQAGMADRPDPAPYARGTLTLWARKDSPLQPISLESLTDRRVSRVAIANPAHAPYGRAAEDALKSLKLYERVSPHLVFAENIAQAAQFAESGNAQLGLISLTTAVSPRFRETGTYVLIPRDAYAPIVQCAVVLARSTSKREAHDFLNWLLSAHVQATLPGLGLTPVK